MEFFDSTDWLGRPGPYSFKWDHLLFLFLFIGLGVLLAFLIRKKQRKTVHLTLVIFHFDISGK